MPTWAISSHFGKCELLLCRYSLEMRIKEGQEEAVIQLIRRHCPAAQRNDIQGTGRLSFNIPQQVMTSIPHCFALTLSNSSCLLHKGGSEILVLTKIFLYSIV